MREVCWFAVPVAVASGALALASPAWAFGALAVGSLRLAVIVRNPKPRRAWLALTGAAATLTLAEILLPGPPAPRPPCHHQESDRPDEEDPFDGVLGFGPRASTVVPAAEMPGNVAFKGTYSIDEDGLRRGFPSDAKQAILFFGGSYTFGLGLSDEETTAYRVGRELADEYACYNFAYGGYGAQQMLAALQGDRVDAIVDGAPKYAFFQLIHSHARRAVGSTPWSLHDPRFEVAPDGSLVRNGYFCDPPGKRGFLERLLRSSAIYRRLANDGLPSHVDLLVAIVRAARDELRARYPSCEFHVILWDKDTWKTKRILDGLVRDGVTTHRVSELLAGFDEDYESWFHSAEDHHPSSMAHARLADFVIDLVRGADAELGLGR